MVHVWLCLCMCRRQSQYGVSSIVLHITFWNRVSHQTWNVLDWLTSKPQASSCLRFSSAGIRSTQGYASLCTQGLWHGCYGSKFRSSYLHRKHFPETSPEPGRWFSIISSKLNSSDDLVDEGDKTCWLSKMAHVEYLDGVWLSLRWY